MTNAINIYKGIELILQYESDAVVTAEHDVLWCGQGNGKSVNEITEEGRNLLLNYGWFIDNDLKCWSTYV